MRLHGRETDALVALETMLARDQTCNDGHFLEACLPREFADQRHFFRGVRLLGDRFEERALRAPVLSVARKRADGLRQRIAVESGALFGRCLRLGQGGEVRHRTAQFAQRQLSVIPLGIFGRHFPIALRLGPVACTCCSAPSPEEALRAGQRRLGRGAVTIEQRRGALAVTHRPERLRAAEPHEVGILVAQGEGPFGDVRPRREEIVHLGGDGDRLARCACALCNRQCLTNESVAVKGRRIEGRAVTQQVHRLERLARTAVVFGQIIDIARIAHRVLRSRAHRTAEQRHARLRHLAIGGGNARDVARCGFEIALPQQRVHPGIVIFGRKAAAEQADEI